jgi:Uma2 family endonuclease
LPDYVRALSQALAQERQRRDKFYEELTEDGKFEFINGQVFMHSPARHRHTLAVLNLSHLLLAHVRLRDLGQVLTDKALCVFPRNDYEPDICFFGKQKAAQLKPDTLKYPVPDLIVEVLSETTERNDRGVKFEDYSAHGVAEYWVIDPDAETVEQYLLREGRYPAAPRQRTGEITSEVVPGFAIPVRAIFDPRANLTALRRLLGSIPCGA